MKPAPFACVCLQKRSEEGVGKLSSNIIEIECLVSIKTVMPYNSHIKNRHLVEGLGLSNLCGE